MGGESPRLLGRFEPAHRDKIVRVESLCQRLDHAAAALAEIWTERPIAEFRLAAASGQRFTRRIDRRVFELAAADGAEKAAVRLEHDAGAAFARHRAGGANDADERRTAVPLNRFSDAGPNLRHCRPLHLIPPRRCVEGDIQTNQRPTSGASAATASTGPTALRIASGVAGASRATGLPGLTECTASAMAANTEIPSISGGSPTAFEW